MSGRCHAPCADRLNSAGFLLGGAVAGLPPGCRQKPLESASRALRRLLLKARKAKGKEGGEALPTQEKIDRVAELQDKLERSSIVVSAGYTGMGANRMVDLRRRLREGGVELVVVKNNLLNLAADAATIPQLKDMVTGQTAIAVGYDDAAIAAKAITDAANAAGAVTINGAVVNREVAMLPAEVSRLAALPPRPTLVAQLLGNMQSPLYGLLSVLNGTVRSLAYVLQARIDQLQPAAEASE